MRSRSKKQKSKKYRSLGSGQETSATSTGLGEQAVSRMQSMDPIVEISADESRILGFIRRDVIWAASILLLIVISLLVVDHQVSDSLAWSSVAEKIAKTAGLIK
jgi:hypothetical protein